MGTGSWSDERRSFPPKTRQRILRRHPTCRCPGCSSCTTPGVACAQPSTEADHIVPHAEGGSDSEANGQGLCTPCHWHKTKAEAARGRARKSRKRPPEPHPGVRGGG